MTVAHDEAQRLLGDEVVFVGVYDPAADDADQNPLRPILDPHNANEGTERGAWQLEESHERFGAGRSVLLDAHNVGIAGNKNIEKWIERGGKIAVVETDGNTMIAVRRRDLDLMTDPRAREFAYADNQVGFTNLSWDVAQLVRDVQGGLDLSTFFTEYELTDFAAQITVPSLGDLAATYGEDEHPDTTALWPSLTLKAPADLLDRFTRLLATFDGATPDEQLVGLVDWGESRDHD